MPLAGLVYLPCLFDGDASKVLPLRESGQYGKMQLVIDGNNQEEKHCKV